MLLGYRSDHHHAHARTPQQQPQPPDLASQCQPCVCRPIQRLCHERRILSQVSHCIRCSALQFLGVIGRQLPGGGLVLAAAALSILVVAAAAAVGGGVAASAAAAPCVELCWCDKPAANAYASGSEVQRRLHGGLQSRHCCRGWWHGAARSNVAPIRQTLRTREQKACHCSCTY